MSYLALVALLYAVVACCLGVHEIRVGLLAEKAEVVYNPNVTDPDTLIGYIQDLGFDAQILVHEEPTEHRLDLIVSRIYIISDSLIIKRLEE